MKQDLEGRSHGYFQKKAVFTDISNSHMLDFIFLPYSVLNHLSLVVMD